MLFETHKQPIWVTLKTNMDFVPHVHNEIEIIICTEGELCAECNFEKKRITVGEAVVAYSGEIHSCFKTEFGKGIMVIASPLLLPNTGAVRRGGFTSCADERLIEVARELLAEYSSDASEDILVGYTCVLLGLISKHLPPVDGLPKLDASIFSEILKYVSLHYTEKITLSELGKRFGVDPCHISRSFTKKLLRTFTEYLHALRVEHAKSLLKHTQKSILTVSLESGFSDQRTFNRVFRELTMTTPKGYRAEK